MASIELANPRDSTRIRKLLSIRVIVIKIISSFFMILGGGVVGREGPTIQIAGSVFRKVNQILPRLVAQDFQKEYDYDRCRPQALQRRSIRRSAELFLQSKN